ncbi:MAG TPA: 4'-phosphopantetheinyl transferase superfamily protein [Candidatus Sulfotelmatobacter sp.]|nr:4'-phosphopantetheinyl transferase superfamily protein [Candidatus Sulfotelmatobacter sp.]
MTIYWLEQREADVPPDNLWLSPNELNRLSTMRIPKRRTDWRLGRWTAKHAVASFLALSQPAFANIEIRAASSGAPEVFLDNQPADVAISLSHSSGTALCTVAPSGTNFGCDLETIEPRDAAFIADYFTREEQSFIGQVAIQDRPLLLALLWSAKESALKALRAGLRLATTSVSVSLGGEWRSPREPLNRHFAHPEEWLPISARYSAGQIFRGYWHTQGNLVRTVVSDAPQFILQQSPCVQKLLATALAT